MTAPTITPLPSVTRDAVGSGASTPTTGPIGEALDPVVGKTTERGDNTAAMGATVATPHPVSAGRGCVSPVASPTRPLAGADFPAAPARAGRERSWGPHATTSRPPRPARGTAARRGSRFTGMPGAATHPTQTSVA